MDIVVYKTSNGVITRLLTIEEEDIILNVDVDESYIIHSIIDVEFDIHYVFGGEVEVMPILSTVASWDKTDILDNSIDTATLSGLPNPSSVVISPLDSTLAYFTDDDVTDGSATITTPVEGVFEITASSEGYRDYIEYISSGNTIGISLMGVFSDFDAANIPEIIEIDTGSVLIADIQSDLRSGQVITMDTDTLTTSVLDPDLYIQEIIYIDKQTINTINRYLEINHNTAILMDTHNTSVDETLEITFPDRIVIHVDNLGVDVSVFNAFPEEII